MMDKGPDAFRTISEVADDLDLPQHVLRFWETRFAQIKPLKRGGGRRYYRPDDVALLRGIRHLLYGRGYTIKGVQRILKEEGLRSVQAIARGERDVAEPDAGQEDAGADRRLPEAAAVAPERPHEAGGPLWEPAAPQSKYVLPQREAAPEPARASIAQKPANAMIERGLSANDVARLRTALEDLAECERVLALIRPASGSGSAHDAD